MRKALLFLLAVTGFLFSVAQDKAPFAKNISLTDINGNSYTLWDELGAGKTVVFDFFSYYCATCQANTPIMDSIWQLYGSTGEVWVWGIETAGYDSVMVQNFAVTYGSTFPVFSTFNGANTQTHEPGLAILEMFNITGTPQYVVVCPDTLFTKLQIGDIPTGIELCNESLTTMPEKPSGYADVYVRDKKLYCSLNTEPTDRVTIEVATVNGTIMASVTFWGSESEACGIMDLSGLTSGLYLVCFSKNSGILGVRKVFL